MRDPLEKAKAAYYSQRYSAGKRRISFQISFEEWHAWWIQELGPDWIKKRGRKQGQYCMARFGDVGPYKLGNIKCVTVGQNHSEGGGNGVLSRGLIERIYKDKGCHRFLAEKHNVNAYAVFDIKHSRSWAKITKDLILGKLCEYHCECHPSRQRSGISGRKCPMV